MGSTIRCRVMPLRLDDISAADLPRVGGKAYNCARLRQARFPVPDGIAVPSDATDDEITALSTHAWFDALPAGTRFAVRSSGIGEDSAGHSFAGLHETRLNVARVDIVDAVIVCRRSADSAAARAYREARQIPDREARIGVLVQVMVPAVTSGVAFTVNPVTGADELVINAGRGLGEALVSGQIDPDEFRVSKTDGAVLSMRPGAGAAGAVAVSTLTPAELAALSTLLTAIERHYGAPQDVEWCHDGREFWVVQSRPVTTRRELTTQNSELGTHHADVEWTRANLAEVLPDQVSPQALRAYVELLNLGERAFFGRLMAPESELGPIVKAFHGRLYFNLSQLRHVIETIGRAPANMLRSFGHSEAIGPEDEIAKLPPLGRFLRALPDALRIVVNTLRAGHVFRAHQAHTGMLLARLNACDPHTLSDRDIAATYDWWAAEAPKTMKAVFVMGSVQIFEDALRAACKATGFSYDRLVYPQLAAGQRSVSTQQAVDLVALAEVARREPAARSCLLATDGAFTDFRAALAGTAFLARLERFLEQYGHRGRYESDWALPRLHEDPASALFAIRAHLQGEPQDMAAKARRQEADAAAALREFEQHVTIWQRVTLLPRVRWTLRGLKQQYLWREQVRSDLTRVVSRMRAWHLVMAERFVELGWIDRRDDYFLLEIDEVKDAARDPGRGPGLRAIASRRAAQLVRERDLRLPLLMRERDLPALLSTPRSGGAATPSGQTAGESTGDLTGLCVSPGSVEAEVVVMRDPSEFAAMKRGAILVAPATDPSWTPLFTLASGVIVEVGGMLSHASTIAREYGLPALANVKNATRLLKTGDRVTLDASGGRVIR
jgi:phosphohistidine swiveling domain-containing protein